MRGNLAAITLFDASPPNALRAPSEMSPRRRDRGLEVWRDGDPPQDAAMKNKVIRTG